MRYYRVFPHKIFPQNPSRSSNFPSLGVVQSKTLTSQLTGILKSSHFSATNAQPWNHIFSSRDYATSAQESKMVPSDTVLSIVNEISGLTLLEVADLTEVLKKKLNVIEMPIMAVMMPGMGFGGMKGGGKVAGAGKGDEVKAEKTAFDLKLEAFDAASKIKVIKEVRSFTDLGLKEAKDLVEKAPTLLKKGVTKEDAEKIIAKMKEVGAKVSME